MIKTVVKRDGTKEAFDPERLLKWAEWAGELGADWSSVLREAFRKCQDGCSTQELHKAMITACLDKKDPAHERMAGRLYIGSIYKECYGDYETIPNLAEMYSDMVELGYWRDMGYSQEELLEYDKFIDHDLDLAMTYSQLKQIVGKYSCQDRVKNKYYETPQFTYMRMALGLSYDKPEEERKRDVFKYYEKFSIKCNVNCPTPNLQNLGTWNLGLASCCLYVVEDTAESLAVGDHIAYMMTCNSAGIGNALLTRSIGDAVRGGMIKHNGKLPYCKSGSTAVAANTQGGRGGSLTTHFCALDPEAKTLIKLRNPTTIASKRIGDIDYSFGSHPALDRRAAQGLSWMLISLKDAPDLWKLYYSDKLEEFEECYQKYENNSLIKKEFVDARALVLMTLQEAFETGRFYDHDLYEMNRHTPFKETIHSSNLC